MSGVSSTDRFKQIVPDSFKGYEVEEAYLAKDPSKGTCIEVTFKKGDQTIKFTSYDSRIIDYMSGRGNSPSTKAKEWFKTVPAVLSKANNPDGTSRVEQGKRGEGTFFSRVWATGLGTTVKEIYKESQMSVDYTGKLKADPLTPDVFRNLSDKDLDVIDWNDCMKRLSSMNPEDRKACLAAIPMDKLANVPPKYQNGKSFFKMIQAAHQFEQIGLDQLSWPPRDSQDRMNLVNGQIDFLNQKSDISRASIEFNKAIDQWEAGVKSREFQN